MAIRFNSSLLARDIETARKRHKLTLHKASVRIGVTQSTLSGLKSGKVKEITVTSLARILDFLGTNDIEKYIYDDGEY